ncbi:hypothetical protein VIGAN_04324300, partial [Vigna angularis var. angularis]
RVRRNNIFEIFRFVSLQVMSFFFVFIEPSKMSTSSLFSYPILHFPTFHSLCNSLLLCSVPAISLPFIKTRNFNFHH